MTFAAVVQGSPTLPVESLSKFSFCLDIALWRPQKDTSAPGSGSCTLSTTNWASSQMPHRAEELTANETSKEHCTAAIAQLQQLNNVVHIPCIVGSKAVLNVLGPPN